MRNARASSATRKVGQAQTLEEPKYRRENEHERQPEQRALHRLIINTRHVEIVQQTPIENKGEGTGDTAESSAYVSERRE